MLRLCDKENDTNGSSQSGLLARWSGRFIMSPPEGLPTCLNQQPQTIPLFKNATNILIGRFPTGFAKQV
jgi:hypothetical protein